MAIFAYIILLMMLIGVVLLGSVFFCEKIFVTLLARKMRLKLYGLIWVPVIGSWMEATVVYKIVGNKEWIRVILFMLSVLTLILLPVAYITSDYGGIYDYIYTGAIIVLIVSYIARGIFHTMAMHKAGMDILFASIVSFLIPPFWAFFISKRIIAPQKR